MHQHTDTSEILLRGMRSALDAWSRRLNGHPEPLYWVLRLQLADTGLGELGTSLASGLASFRELFAAFEE